ncbi:hypothetical protein NGF19_21930 [Streptomyces sp. RY43-2]|uniref:Uncharacterized protein n=1 Tax=Streptomyces macrolidinus TaxID=2952607 RepID=A0ABT0ZIL7_9ACTN|nr:hypothetical protein [Streptomyces macrolidinus]MCN9243411.1 hypothetical protein [Streptomyces macrolidinus]
MATARRTTVVLDEIELLKAEEEELEEIFRTSPPGEIPKGPMEGTAVLPWAGSVGARLLAVFVGLNLWRGKLFSPDGHLSNRLTPLDLLAVVGTVTVGPSQLDGQDCIVVDYSRTSLLAQGVRDEIRQAAPDLYLGLVWLFGHKVGWFTLRVPGGGNA